MQTIQLKNQENEVFYDKLTFIYLEIPHFKKTEEELETTLDKWLYFLRNLEDLQEMPRVFMGEEEFEDLSRPKKILDYKYDKGFDEGKQQGMEDALRKLTDSGMDRAQAKLIIGLQEKPQS